MGVENVLFLTVAAHKCSLSMQKFDAFAVIWSVVHLQTAGLCRKHVARILPQRKPKRNFLREGDGRFKNQVKKEFPPGFLTAMSKITLSIKSGKDGLVDLFYIGSSSSLVNIYQLRMHSAGIHCSAKKRPHSAISKDSRFDRKVKP